VQKVLLPRIVVPIALLLGSASAQIEKPPANSERPQGTQITNVPAEDRRPSETEQDRQLQDRQLKDQGEQGTQRNAQSETQRGASPTPLPPEPDIEFQEFVASSLGYRLPIFGQDLFRNPPSTFAPVDRIPVTPDYLIGPGDELLIRAWGQIDVNYRAVVDRTGAIYIPKVGSITVVGLRYDQLHATLHDAIGRVYKNFDLTVTLGQLRSIQVFVIGQVRRPGVYTVSSLSTLVNALFVSGGPSNRGSMRRIQLKRSGQIVTTFDFYDLLTNGDKSKDRPLLPGDVIYVPPVGRLVAVGGSVNVPAIFELQEHDTLGQVIAYAGGITTTGASEKAIVERIDDHHVRRADEITLSGDGLKRELHDGDVVRFLHISPKFDNAITLRGNVAVPGRYPFRTGMRVHDLIPNREFLVTDEYWRRQNQLGRKADDGFLLPDERERLKIASPHPTLDKSAQSTADLTDGTSRTEAQRAQEEELKNQVKRSGAEINWQYAVIQRVSPSDLITSLLPFNLGKAIAGEESQNLVLQPGDVITIFSQHDMQVPEGQQTKFIRLEGEFLTAGVYQAEPGEGLRHLIARVGGLTPQAYLYGSEFSRESTREDQQKRLDEYINELERSIARNASSQRNLSGEEALTERQSLEGQRSLLDKLRQLRATGRIVLELKPNAEDLDAIPDLPLEDGDRLLVPFRPATVNVIGAVYNSSSFIFQPGKTVGDYLRVSGGATRNGDKGRLFVIKADGTTFTGHGHNGLFLKSLTEVRLMPGDTIVVPEKLDKGVVLRGFKDWTQIVGTFIIGAAAAKVLFP
jgi:polysaccharide export outer membrane protein